MAGTYYGYVERNAGDQVDWTKIGLDITNMLSEENKRREDIKDELDKNSRAFGEILSNAPTGENESLNKWAMDYADSAQQARLIQDRLLKSGSLKLKDYNMMRQNLNDGTSSAFGLLKEYQKEYANRMERFNKGDSHALEVWQLSMLEGLGKFNETGLYINPTDYSVFVAKKSYNKKTGVYEMSNNPNDYRSVTQLRGLLKSKIDRFKTESVLQAEVDRLGDYMYAQAGKTGYETITDAMKSPYFKEAQDKFIAKIVNDNINSSSVLSSDLLINEKTGNAYDFTLDEKEAKKNPDLIYLESEPTSGRLIPKLNADQKASVEDYLRARMNAMIDRKMSVSQYPQERDSEAKAKEDAGRKYEDEAVNMMGNLYYGNEEELKTAIDYFKGLNGKIESIRRDGDGVYITYDDGSKKDIPFRSATGKLIPLADWIKGGTELTKISNIDEALKRGSYVEGAKFNPTGTAAAKTRYIVGNYDERTVSIGTDDKGKSIRKPVVDIIGEGINSSDAAKGLVDAANKIFNEDVTDKKEIIWIPKDQFPSEASASEFRRSVAQIYLPDVMDIPVFIPNNLKAASIKNIIRAIHDAQVNKVKISRDAIKRLFADERMYQRYNSDSVLEKYGVSVPKQTNIVTEGSPL